MELHSYICMYYNMYVHNNSSYRYSVIALYMVDNNYVLFICVVLIYVCSYMERTGSVNYMDFG